MKYGTLLLVLLGLSAVCCLPSKIKGRQEEEPAAETSDEAAATATSDKNSADIKLPAALHHLNLLGAIGHIISPLLKGILEPLLLNIVYGVVGGIISYIKHADKIVQDGHLHDAHAEHDQEYYSHKPAQFPEYKADGHAPFSNIFNGIDAYVMQVPGDRKYLFISPEKGTEIKEADKDAAAQVDEIPFSANPLLNSLFGMIRVRSGPIPDKNVENYVKQQLGASEADAASD